MKKRVLIIILLTMKIIFANAKPPYPIIFVHGLAGGSDETFEESMQFLNMGVTYE